MHKSRKIWVQTNTCEHTTHWFTLQWFRLVKMQYQGIALSVLSEPAIKKIFSKYRAVWPQQNNSWICISLAISAAAFFLCGFCTFCLVGCSFDNIDDPKLSGKCVQRFITLNKSLNIRCYNVFLCFAWCYTTTFVMPPDLMIKQHAKKGNSCLSRIFRRFWDSRRVWRAIWGGGGDCLAMYSEQSLKCVEQLGGAVLGKWLHKFIAVIFIWLSTSHLDCKRHQGPDYYTCT